MKKGEQSKQHLIECAARLFWQDGYNATGISKILQEAAMTKGSFYFYFKSKKELADAVVSYYREVIFSFLQDAAKDAHWEDFVRKFTAAMLRNAAEGTHYGCPFAAVGMETAFSEPGVARHYAGALNEAAELFRRILERSGIPQSHSAALANRLFAIYEGELMLYRVSKDAFYIKQLESHLLGTYEEYRKVHLL